MLKDPIRKLAGTGRGWSRCAAAPVQARDPRFGVRSNIVCDTLTDFGRDITFNRVTDERAENNWSLCVLSAGAADANTAARAALYVQSVLRRDYDLMTD